MACGWASEILHQLIYGLSHDFVRVSTIQGGAGFRNHPQYHLGHLTLNLPIRVSNFTYFDGKKNRVFL